MSMSRWRQRVQWREATRRLVRGTQWLWWARGGGLPRWLQELARQSAAARAMGGRTHRRLARSQRTLRAQGAVDVHVRMLCPFGP
jgi:hypothetical protein